MYLLQNLPQRITDSNNDACAGALLNVYVTGTTTRVPLYANKAGSSNLTNPVTASASGIFPQVWIDGTTEVAYTITKADGTAIAGMSWQNVPGLGIVAGLSASTDATQGAGMVGFSDSLTYASGTAGLALKGFVNAQAAPFNAKGDGVAADLPALVAAEAAAFASGRALLLPGGTYCVDGQWSVRVPVIAYGATIQQTRQVVSTNNAFGTVTLSEDDVTIAGLSVDADFKTSGFTGDGVDRAKLIDCNASNCVNLGFGFFGGDSIHIERCHANEIRYNATSATGLPADPFGFFGCTRSKWVSCVAEDFRRIGFVADASGSTKCAQIQAIFCVAKNAHDCDDSTTEYNAGFWAENTNSVDWLYCIASDIATGIGQTSARVAGLWALGGGNDSRGNVNVIGCRVFGGTNYLDMAMPVSGTGTYADVLIENCYLNRARTGIQSGCGLNSLTIRNLVIEDIVNTNGSQGGIVVDGTSAGINVLEIDKVAVSNATWHADAGLINFTTGVTGCKYTLRNVKGNVPHIMRGNVARIRTEECEIACGSTTYSSFLAAYIEHIDPTFTSRNGVSSDYITNASGLASGSEVIFRGGMVTGYTGGWSHEFSGTNITTRCFGTKFDKFSWQISTVGTFTNRFDGCAFLNVPPTVGSIRANFNAPTKQVLMVLGCYFESASASDTPIRLWNTAPTNSILSNNIRKTATALHSLGTITADVNNVAV